MPMQIVPWKSSDELETLRVWFYSDDRNLRYKAVRRVCAYATRGPLLHAVDTTCLLTSVQLQDTNESSADVLVLRTSYSMVLIKFVNGLLDPYQKSIHAVPLQVIARKLELPSKFVEIRHLATHEHLPSIVVLRKLASEALVWLKTHFWDATVVSDGTEFSVKSRYDKFNDEDRAGHVIRLCKVVRSVRKSLVSVQECIETLDKFLALKHEPYELLDMLLDVFITDNVLGGKLKTESSFQKFCGLYMPVFSHLERNSVVKHGVQKSFGVSFYDELFRRFCEKSNKEGQFWASSWMKFMIEKKLVTSKDAIEHLKIATFSVTPLLELIGPENEPGLKTLYNLEKFKTEKSANVKRVLTLSPDELLLDLKNLKKRAKKGSSNGGTAQKRVILWEKVEYYEPTPFGVAP